MYLSGIFPLTEFPYLLPLCTLTMYNFSEHKRVGDAWMSKPFYTRPGGYKLGLQVISIGDSYGTDIHVGVCIYLQKGEYDESLNGQWGDYTSTTHLEGG